MPYISLYRKYRSQTFDDVIGQDHVVRTIRNAIKTGRIGQGYLFCGSRGTGKTTVARLIAKALNCEHGPTPDPCNVCGACLAITGGAAVDVIEMDAASNRGVDDVDNLRDGVKYPPMQLRYKVYIIDEAHQLSATAKDAFLKTLEEPPPHAVFILATTEANKIPVTIRSRCQQFDFRRGTVQEIGERLRHVIESEGVAAEAEAVELIARSANGSYRDSLSLLEQIMAYTEGSMTAKDVYTVLGMVEEDVLLELGQVLASGDTARAFDIADRLLREGRDVKELLRSAAEHFRDVLALKVGADQRKQADQKWRDQAELFTQDQLVRLVDIFAAAEKELRWNEQHRLGLEMALLRAMTLPVAQVVHAQPAAAAAPRPAPRPAVPESRPEPRREAPAPAPRAAEVARPEPTYAAPAAEQPSDAAAASATPTGSATLSDIQRNWQKIMMHLKKVLKQPSVEAQAREGTPVELEGTVLTVAFPQTRRFHQAGTAQNAEKLAMAIEEVMGTRLKVAAVLVEESGSHTGSLEQSAVPEPKGPEEHPQKNALLTMFDGTEVDPGADPWGEE